MLLRRLLLDCLPQWITRWGKPLLGFVHEITGIKLIAVRIGHASVHEAGKKKAGEKSIRTHHRLYIQVPDSLLRERLSRLDRTMGMRHRDPEIGALSLANNLVSGS